MANAKFIATIATLTLAGCAAAVDEKSNLTGDYLSARLAARVNSIEQASQSFSHAASMAPGQPALVRDAFLYRLAAGDVEGALPYARDLTAPGAEESNDLARLSLAAGAIRDGQLAAARRYLQSEFREPFTQSLGHLLNVWITADLDSPDAAIEKLEGAGAEIFKGFDATHTAFLAERSGDIDRAREAHQVSVFSLGGPVGREAFGAFLERHGEKAQARDYYSSLTKQPGPPRRMAQAGLKRLERGNASDAYADVDARQGAAIAFYSYAGAILDQTARERQRAIEAGFNVGDPRFNAPLALAQIAIYLAPELIDARQLVGEIFSTYGEYEAARDALATIPPAAPQYEQARIAMAVGLARAERDDEAITVLKETIAKDAKAEEARLTLSNLYAARERYSEAAKAASQGIAQLEDPDREDAWRYYIARGAALIELGRWSEAEGDLEKALEIAPEEPTVLNYLGYSWAERGINLDEAFALIEKAVALAPHSGAIIDSLGWAHYQLGQYEEAVGHLENAASLEPADPTITDHLGDVYWKLGRKTEARFQWERVLELEPSDKQQRLVNEKLRDGLVDDVPRKNDRR